MKNKNTSTGDEGELFVSVPDTDEINKLSPIEIDGVSEEKIEEEAIASLPFGEGEATLDSLLADTDEHIVAYETPEEAARYESFLADYKSVVSKMLAKAESEKQRSDDASASEADEVSASEADEVSASETDEVSASETDEVSASETDEVSASEADEASASEADEPEIEIEEGLFHGEIVEKSLRINPEDHISLVERTVPEEAEAMADGEDTEADEVTQLSLDFGDEVTEDEEDTEPSEPERNINKYDPEKPRRVDTVFEFVELFIFTLLAVMVLTSFFFRQSVVDGSSMMATLENGDRLLIWNFMYTPDYGDIVVFEDYSTSEKKPLVKRVIGLPGDHIKVIGTDVYRNGELLDEEYVYISGKIPLTLSGVWTVGEGEVFVMGDHRNDSKDSRDREVGPIDMDGILGKVIFRFYPFSDMGVVE